MTDVLTQRSGVTHNHIVIEAETLIHRRYGAAPARRLPQDVVPLLDIVWITPELHAAAVVAPSPTSADAHRSLTA